MKLSNSEINTIYHFIIKKMIKENKAAITRLVIFGSFAAIIQAIIFLILSFLVSGKSFVGALQSKTLIEINFLKTLDVTSDYLIIPLLFILSAYFSYLASKSILNIWINVEKTSLEDILNNFKKNKLEFDKKIKNRIIQKLRNTSRLGMFSRNFNLIIIPFLRLCFFILICFLINFKSSIIIFLISFIIIYYMIKKIGITLYNRSIRAPEEQRNFYLHAIDNFKITEQNSHTANLYTKMEKWKLFLYSIFTVLISINFFILFINNNDDAEKIFLFFQIASLLQMGRILYSFLNLSRYVNSILIHQKFIQLLKKTTNVNNLIDELVD